MSVPDMVPWAQWSSSSKAVKSEKFALGHLAGISSS